jgi:hypothetical protein
LRAFSSVSCPHLAELVGEVEQDRAGLAELEVAVDQRRHLAEAVDGEVIRLLVRAGTQIDVLVGKRLAHQRQSQARLVGWAAQPDAVKRHLRHIVLPRSVDGGSIALERGPVKPV